LIGDNPFIGVSHLSQARARDRVQRLDIESITEVIDKAISCGASGYTFSIPHPTNLEIMKSWKKKDGTARSFGLYPILPYAEGYVRTANEKGMMGLTKELISRLPFGAKAKFLLEGGISAVTSDPVRMLNAYIDMELSSYLSTKPENTNLQAVFLHEVIVDLALSFGLANMFDSFIKHVRDKYHATPGFVTRNFARFVDFLEDNMSFRDLIIMTPFNKIGFQMNPSRESCEKHLAELSNARVFGMSVLAAGYLSLNDAIEYLRTLPNLSGVAVGASSIEHAEDTFTKLKSLDS
jgi:hypothetical protein